MLRSFRNNIKGRFGKVLLGLIIVPFVGFGAADLLMNRGGPAEIFEVNGVKGDERMLAQEIQLARNSMVRRMGDEVSYEDLTEEKLGPIAKETIIQRLLMDDTGQNLNMSVPDSLIDRSIVTDPAFQVDGSFSSEQMTQVLAASGFDLALLKQKTRTGMLDRQFQAGVAGSSFAGMPDLELLQRITSEKRKIDWLQLARADYQNEVSVSDEELQEYYHLNGKDLRTELAVDAEYILLSVDGFRPEVSEEEIIAEYERQKTLFEPVESRKVAHILFEVGPDQTEVEATDRAIELQQRIAQGENFAALAKEFSQDSGSAAEGGDLGFTEQDGSFPEAFEEAVFALQIGGVSDPVTTDAGVHLIQVSEVKSSTMPTLAELRMLIVDQLQLSVATKQFVEVSESLADMVFNADGLAGSAETLGLELQSVAKLMRSGRSLERDNVALVMRDPRVLNALYSNEVLEEGLNSELIELTDEQRIVVRVIEAYPPRQLTFEEARESIEKVLMGEKLTARLIEISSTILEAVAQGESFKDAASRFSIELNQDEEVQRHSQNLAPEVLGAVFELARNEKGKNVHQAEDAEGNLTIFQLKEVVDGEEVPGDEIAGMLGRQVQSLYANQEYSAFWKIVRDRASIVEY